MYLEAAERDEAFRRFAFRYDAIDSRQVERIPLDDSVRRPPTRHTWMRTTEPLPDNPEVHLALLAYMSDMDFMSTSMLPHGGRGIRQNIQWASLDHALWFHRPFRADEWLLFAKEGPNASNARRASSQRRMAWAGSWPMSRMSLPIRPGS